MSKSIPGEARSLFEQGEAFREAAEVLFERLAAGRGNLLAPLATCNAFSLELFLKAAKCLDAAEHLREHAVDLLYNDLAQEARDEIEPRAKRAYEREPHGELMDGLLGKRTAFDLAAILRVSSKAFEKFRYSAPDDAARMSCEYSAHCVAVAVREYILIRHPTWHVDGLSLAIE